MRAPVGSARAEALCAASDVTGAKTEGAALTALALDADDVLATETLPTHVALTASRDVTVGWQRASNVAVTRTTAEQGDEKLTHLMCG